MNFCPPRVDIVQGLVSSLVVMGGAVDLCEVWPETVLSKEEWMQFKSWRIGRNIMKRLSSIYDLALQS